MAKGRQGLYLEAWKFSVYISLPIIASVYYSNPETQRYWADYWKFITYPENPNTNVKQKIQALAEEKELKREQHLAYQKQLQELQRLADASNQNAMSYGDDDTASQKSTSSSSSSFWWRRWFSRSETEHVGKKHDSSS
jgi:hypothetical protein